MVVILFTISACKKTNTDRSEILNKELLAGKSGSSGVKINAPSNLAGTTQSTSSIRLTWKDNSNNEDGFTIERKVLNGTYSAVASLPANTTTYTDNSLSEGISYTYRIKAYKGSSSSSYSSEITITTQVDISTALLAYFPFTGNAGDSSGNGNHGTINGGVSLTTDRFSKNNSAYFFNGVDGYISVPSLNSSQYKPITYAAWVILSSFFQPTQNLIEFKTVMGRNTIYVADCGVIGFVADRNGTYDNNFVMWRGGGVTGNVPYSKTNFSLNTWIHIAWTQASNGDWQWYINGDLTNSGNFTDSFGYYDYFRIGGCNNNGRYWDNKIDDVRIYTRVLNATQIKYLATH
jgi:hypothetical protein